MGFPGACTFSGMTSSPLVAVGDGQRFRPQSDAPGRRALQEFGVTCEVRALSAHRTPDETIAWARGAVDRGLRVLIAGAGAAAHLPGVVAAVTPLPVIGVPIDATSLGGLDALLSIAQMPAGVPVATSPSEALATPVCWRRGSSARETTRCATGRRLPGASRRLRARTRRPRAGRAGRDLARGARRRPDRQHGHAGRRARVLWRPCRARTASSWWCSTTSRRDGTVEAIRDAYPGVRVIEGERRLGFGANNNVLIRHDGAVRVPAQSRHGVRARVGRAAGRRARPRARRGGVAPRVVFGDGRVQDNAWRFPSPATAVRAALTLGRSGITLSGGDAPHRVEWAMACALMLRRSALDAVGLFDEGYFMYSEETDLERRLGRRRPCGGVDARRDRRAPPGPVDRSGARTTRQRGVARPAPLLGQAPPPTGRGIAALAPGAGNTSRLSVLAPCCCVCRRGCGRYRWRRPIPPSGGSARGTRCSACAAPASRSSRPSSTAVARLQVTTRQERDRAESLLVVARADLPGYVIEAAVRRSTTTASGVAPFFNSSAVSNWSGQT